MAKKKYIVNHPNLHLAVTENGKTKVQHVEKGTEYQCDELKSDNHLIAGKKLVAAVAEKKVKSS